MYSQYYEDYWNALLKFVDSLPRRSSYRPRRRTYDDYEEREEYVASEWNDGIDLSGYDVSDDDMNDYYEYLRGR